jgi:hypothetical protein
MSLLQKIRVSRQALSRPIVQPIIQGFLEFKAPKPLSGSFEVSLEWFKKFMKAKLGWSFRVATIVVAKLPPNWEDQGIEMAHRVAYLVKTYNVLASLVINMNQIGIHLVPIGGERTWENKGSKDIHVIKVEDKKQITIAISSAVDGSFLPL